MQADFDDDEYASLGDGKIVHDPIHGQITLEPLLLRILDTAEFQRLRDLKQLGCAYLVFPGASHNRFEHCMGVAHLAQQMLTHLRDTQPELEITPHDIELVKLAGLCHDLGHGPFSHMFEEFVLAVDPESTFRHERMSLQMLETLLRRNNIPMTDDDMQFLRELINPYDNPTQSHPRRFLYDIVANARNSVDVDKFDYLQRDCHNLGMATNLKHDRLIRHCRVIDNEICFNSKEVYNLYELFHTRYSLFKQVYSHRVSKSIEYMICDVFKLADPVLHLSAATASPEEYAKLTDCVLKQIEISTDPRLAEARHLIMRIRTRQLYKLVDETVLPVEVPTVLGEVTATQILDCYPPSRALLSEDDLHVQNLRINYAMKDKNPVDNIKFFHKSNPNVSFPIPKHKVSHIIPAHFQERILRVFLRDVTEDKMSLARDAVTHFLEHNKCLTPEMPLRSLSSPSVLHVAKPIRGGSTFSRASAAAAAAQQRGRIPESAAEDEEEDDLPGSQATAQTEVDGGGTAMDETDGANVSVQMAPYANGNGLHAAVLDRLMSASRPADSSTVAASSASAADASQLLEADFTSSSRPLSTPTKAPQAKSARRKSSAAAADGATAPPTVLLDRYPALENAATSAAAAAAPASAAPLSARVAGAARVAPGSTLSVPSSSPYRRDREGSSPCPTPQKRRNTALKNPATPAGKLAAQVAASRANTPATGSAAITPASQLSKRQKIAHGTPLLMQPLPPSSARPAAPLSPVQPTSADSSSATNVPVASASAAPLTRASRSNSRSNATDAAASADDTAAPLAKRTPSLTAKSLQY